MVHKHSRSNNLLFSLSYLSGNSDLLAKAEVSEADLALRDSAPRARDALARAPVWFPCHLVTVCRKTNPLNRRDFIILFGHTGRKRLPCLPNLPPGMGADQH